MPQPKPLPPIPTGTAHPSPDGKNIDREQSLAVEAPAPALWKTVSLPAHRPEDHKEKHHPVDQSPPWIHAK